MEKAIILDFMGVVADFNLKKIIKELTLKQKFSALRVFLTLRKNEFAKNAFKDYQKGIIDLKEFEHVVAEICPHSSYIIPIFLEKFSKGVTINDDVLDMAFALKNYGVKMLLMSNTIPETEKIIEDCFVYAYFDGVICSTQIKCKKPTPDIYKYAIEKYNIDPFSSLMIDDTQKNLDVASKFGFETKKCKTSKETLEFLTNYLHNLKETESRNRKNNEI